MSIEYISRVWKDKTIRNRMELLIMLALADNSNDEGCCYPAIKTLAAKSRMTERAVYQTCRGLEGRNLIRRETRQSQYGTNLFYLYPECRAGLTLNTVQDPPEYRAGSTLNTVQGQTAPHIRGTVIRNHKEEPVAEDGDSKDLKAVSELKPEATASDPLAAFPEAKLWNERCRNLPSVKMVVNGRLKALQARRKESFWRDNIREALDKVAASEFCCGKSERGWKASFDWLLKPDSIVKVLEGKYDNRDGHNSSSKLEAALGFKIDGWKRRVEA